VIVLIAAAWLTALPARALDIQEITTPGGVTYWLVEEPAIPIVALEMSFRGGARLDRDGRGGTAAMVASLLGKGAGALDEVAFEQARDALSARFGFGSGRDSFTVSARLLAENAQASAELLASTLTDPQFAPQPTERVRAQILAGIAEAETDPGSVARRAWLASAFPDHPYGRPSSGTATSVAAITREDLTGALPRLLTRANAKVAIVGAIEPEAASRLVDTLMAGLPEGEEIARTWQPSAPEPGIEVIALDVPQSAAIFGHGAIPRTDPDFIPAFVMNYILGGGSFNSRLTEEVREKRGLAYSVYSYMSVFDERALYMGSVQTANEGMAQSLDVIRAEWTRMAEEGLTEADLEKAKKYLTGAFPLRFDSNAKIAGYLVFLQEEGLGRRYLEERNDLIMAVTLEDTNRAAARLLQPDALSITVVGMPEGISSTR
ncbi:MAG: pitrilysin family protein, partial [Pseudomonadota bacterium]